MGFLLQLLKPVMNDIGRCDNCNEFLPGSCLEYGDNAEMA